MSPQFKNFSFNSPTIYPWQNIHDSTFGEFWQYDGRYSQSVFVRGTTQSQILMQGDYPAGTYTVKVEIDNRNKIEDGEEKNGVFKILSIDQNGTFEKSTAMLNHGFQKNEFVFTLTENFNLIGFKVSRIGKGNELEIFVYEFKIISYHK